VDVDSTYRELVGTAGDHEPSIRLHLKKSPVPAPAAPDTQNIRFESGSATLAGTVVLPAGAGPHPGVVYVAGRGCASRRGGLRRLRWLAQQGIAGLAYDNRGSGRSSGDCKTTTLQTESRDVQAALRTLRRRAEVDAERVGAWANSAGGWYVPHAAARSETPPSFIAMQGGPATSVQGQQTDNAQEIAGELGLAPSDSAAFLRYVDLMFATDRPDEAVFDEMQSLLDHSEPDGRTRSWCGTRRSETCPQPPPAWTACGCGATPTTRPRTFAAFGFPFSPSTGPRTASCRPPRMHCSCAACFAKTTGLASR
jgi:pimeloyl-ACP methyl ester carboxylesterase